MSSETTNWEAVARYLAGEGSPEEQAAVRQWLAEHPADAKMVVALDDALNRLALGPDATEGIDVESALASVKARRGKAKVLQFRPRGFEWVPIAAAAAIVIALGTWMFRPAARTGTPATAIAERTLTTPVGGRDSLVLPDGSQVLLGPGSSLIIAQGYGQSERRISLTGEALFSVVHDKKPFIVVANGSEIRDVGTAFVVHSDAGGVRVAVTEGIVELIAGHRAATQLKAGDAASVSPAGDVTAQRGVGADADLAWTRGRLVFRDTPLSEVAEDLKRWYGVELEIRDSVLRRRPLSATFSATDSLGGVLGVIGGAMGATMDRRGDTVVVRSAR